MMGTFFADHDILNPIFQARLAVQTFRGQALFWWRAHSALLPELVVTYEQLLEWVRAELVPMADPGTAVLSWRQLRYMGDVDDYLHQLDQLSTHFPLPHETLLAMSAEPLGAEAISAVYKADQMYGPGGMPYARLRKFLQSHLLQLSAFQRRQLADNPPMATGYGKPAASSSTRASSFPDPRTFR